MAALDVEEESVLTAIFADSFPETWQSNPDFVHYLSELSSFGVEKLAQEPDRLAEEKSQILEETQNLAFQNYKTFIQTADCSRDIFEDFQIIEKHVGDLLEKLPEFSTNCSTVLKQAQDISSSRKMNTLTLQRHTQLLEVLEVPQLMDTCVRNCYYDEALELAAYVKRLEKKHASIHVIANIVNEVKLSSQLMLNQLIQQLRTNVQLPACLRVIGYLRRMDVFTEAELRIKFLQARDAWFQGILDAIPREDAYTHITKTVEASRVHLFDIITQYRAIFSDEDPIVATAKDDSLNEAALFHGWIVQKVSQFLALLEQDLARGVGGRLDSILGQCMYFGLSFSRVGADFRGLLTPVFQRAALNGLNKALSEANKRFEDNMRSYSLLSSSSSSVGGLPYAATSQAGQLYPPMVLLDFYPLAAYCNDVLNTFNELRLCAPVALATEVATSLHASFLGVNRVILAFHRAEETTFDKKEREQFNSFCSAYAHSLLPYLNKCLQTLFPPVQIAQVLGMSVSDVFKLGNIGQVNIEAVLQNVEHLVPVIEEEPVPSTVTVTVGPSSPLTSSEQTSALFEDQTKHESETVRIGDILSDKTEEDKQEKQSEIVSEQTISPGQSEPMVSEQTISPDQSEPMVSEQTISPDQSELTVSKSDNEKESGQSEELLQTPKVTFITGSDTEDESELTVAPPDIDSIDLSNMNLEPADSFNVNIDTDLSALAADVLTGQSVTQGADDEKKDD